jgi:formamidopyrimidine-DNA glycosylase
VKSTNDEPSLSHRITRLVISDVNVLTKYYRLAVLLLVGAMIVHLAFISSITIASAFEKVDHVIFVVFNITVVLIEVMLSRIAFMLGSRLGQLKDLQVVVEILGPEFTPDSFQATVKGLMALRRDLPSTLKVVDVEKLLASIKKPGEKSTKD